MHVSSLLSRRAFTLHDFYTPPPPTFSHVTQWIGNVAIREPTRRRLLRWGERKRIRWIANTSVLPPPLVLRLHQPRWRPIRWGHLRRNLNLERPPGIWLHLLREWQPTVNTTPTTMCTKSIRLVCIQTVTISVSHFFTVFTHISHKNEVVMIWKEDKSLILI